MYNAKACSAWPWGLAGHIELKTFLQVLLAEENMFPRRKDVLGPDQADCCRPHSALGYLGQAAGTRSLVTGSLKI